MTAVNPSRRPRTEREVRIDLAAAYRLAALAGWDDTIYTHLSAAVPGEPGVYLLNEFGLAFEEVTASSLVKVDVHGRVVGAVVDSVSDVLELAGDVIKPAPEMSSSVDTSFITGIASVGERMLILMDIEAFMSGADMGLTDSAAQGLQ